MCTHEHDLPKTYEYTIAFSDGDGGKEAWVLLSDMILWVRASRIYQARLARRFLCLHVLADGAPYARRIEFTTYFPRLTCTSYGPTSNVRKLWEG